jgi:hypothetical protein
MISPVVHTLNPNSDSKLELVKHRSSKKLVSKRYVVEADVIKEIHVNDKAKTKLKKFIADKIISVFKIAHTKKTDLKVVEEVKEDYYSELVNKLPPSSNPMHTHKSETNLLIKSRENIVVVVEDNKVESNKVECNEMVVDKAKIKIAGRLNFLNEQYKIQQKSLFDSINRKWSKIKPVIETKSGRNVLDGEAKEIIESIMKVETWLKKDEKIIKNHN